MAGNSQRKGAKRAVGSKKGAVVGTGGAKSKGLRPKGPTPRAEDRTKAAKRAGSPGSSASRAARSSGGESRTSSGTRSFSNRPGTRTARPAPRKGGPVTRESSETVVGRNSVLEALRAGVPATTLYVAERIDADDRVREAIKLAADRGLALLETPRTELDRITSGAVHQGLGLQVPPYSYAHADDLPARATGQGQVPLLVALDSVTDPRNLGAVVRSAAAFGAHGVIVPERRSAGMTAGAWKASAGAAARVPVARVTNLTRQLEAYRRAGFVVVGLTADGMVAAADLDVSVDPLVLVVGSEDQGLSRLVQRSCDVLVQIPMTMGNESLNAGVAAGIVLYEVARHRSAAALR